VSIGSRLIVWGSVGAMSTADSLINRPPDNLGILFLFYFSRHKLEISRENAQAP
tara:strand:- start:206 stop:367 length:162 start_codon:yes stop_codon:yes gene_type:complete